jgi:hypothetical protein
VWIGTNLGIISGSILGWWPLIFVFIGLSIIFPKQEYGWQKWEHFGKSCEDMCKNMNWDEFGDEMEKFGKKMERKFGKKKRTSRKKTTRRKPARKRTKKKSKKRRRR